MDIRPPHLGVVFGERKKGDPKLATRDFQNFLSQLEHRNFVGIAQVDDQRLGARRQSEPIDSLDQIADITEAAGLRSVAINR